jgi:N-acetylmuramoyl-L-alanine amidase
VRAAVSTLTSLSAKVSAHLVIGRDGSITQLVPFNMIAWHAGASSWDGRVSLNKYSIGFELDNNGRLTRKGKQWASIFGHIIPDDQVMEAYHKNGKGPYGWQTYTEAQILATQEASQALFQAYQLLDVAGHDDIAPLRKIDPGPAFPMESFRAKIVGRVENVPPLYETTANLNIRSGPGSQFKTLIKKPLPKGALLERLVIQGSWMHVKVLDVIDGVMDLQGWVYTRYVNRVIINNPR